MYLVHIMEIKMEPIKLWEQLFCSYLIPGGHRNSDNKNQRHYKKIKLLIYS